MLEQGTPKPNRHAAAIERYARAALHVPVQVRPLGQVAALPVYLSALYTLYAAELDERPCVIFQAIKETPSPTDIGKHAAALTRILNRLTIYTATGLSPYQRTQLTRIGIPFIVPDNQLYVPALAIDLRERFRPGPVERGDALTPAAQAILFHHLLRRRETALTPSAFAQDLNHTAMTAGRAVDVLADAGLASLEWHGKEKRVLFLQPRRALFDAAKHRLLTPVRARKHVRGAIPTTWIEAGERALAARTDLVQPAQLCVAVDARAWRTLVRTHDLEETGAGEGAAVVETWAYDPAPLTDTPHVDPLSLYAHFHRARDERVAMAAEQLLAQVPW